MRRRFAPRPALLLILSCAASLALGGCPAREQPAKTGEPAPPSPEETARARLTELEEDNRFLEEQLRHKDEFVQAYSEMMDGILGNLRAIAGDEGRALTITRAMELETGYRRLDYAEEIQEILGSIEQQLKKSSEAEQGLRELLETARSETGALAATVDQLSQTVDGLRALVEEKELRIAEQRAEVARLIERLKEQERLAEQYKEAASGYLLATDKKGLRALRQKDVLRLPFGKNRLEVTPKALVGGAYEASFERVDTTVATIVLSETARKGEVRSLHRKDPDLAQIAVESGNLVIRIEDPKTFWRISRFLIVAVD